jgi:arginyl-tRNA synthetase
MLMLLEKRTLLERVLRESTGLDDVLLSEGGEHADLATTIAFALAKQKKQAPVRIARELVDELMKHPDLQGILIEAKGPYINFIFGKEYVSEAVKEAVKPGFGSFPKKGIRVVLEHTSANPNGPLHVGHIRNSIIGDTLARVFRKAGYGLEVQY